MKPATQPFPTAEAAADFLLDFLGSEKAPGAMPFVVLDGFLTGILLMPSLILPSHWLNEIWGDEPPAFEDVGHANKVIGAIMMHYNDLNFRLNPDLGGNPAEFELIFDRDNIDLARLWCSGFVCAIGIAPDAMQLLESIGSDETDSPMVLLAPMIVLGGAQDKSNPLWTKNQREHRANELQAIDALPLAIEGLSALRNALRREAVSSLVVDTGPIGRRPPQAKPGRSPRSARNQ